MQSLDLSKEQKDKLVEMCIKLFPEYKHIQLADGSCDFCLPSTLLLSTNIEPRHNSWILIHWFEFCLTHLFNKLMVMPNGYESIEDYISVNSYFIFGHPVDYLYYEFKKLK